MDQKEIAAISKIYFEFRQRIILRLNEFEELFKRKNNEEIFGELCFCLLTPQSKARTCWKAIESLKLKNLLLSSDPKLIEKELVGVRFKYKKARYIIEARTKISENQEINLIAKLKTAAGDLMMREWLVKTIKGLGYKEASHFLRNIGFGEHIAILDRHILKNLVKCGVIGEIPKTLTKKNYLELEKKMAFFSEKINIPLNHLDFVLWCRETGEIFK